MSCEHLRVPYYCSTDSILTTMMHELSGHSGSAHRLSIWNGYDLTTNSGLKAVFDKIDVLRPEHVWLSPDCGPYSIMQNVNQRTPEQCEALAEKRRDALKQYTAWKKGGMPSSSTRHAQSYSGTVTKGVFTPHGNSHKLARPGLSLSFRNLQFWMVCILPK